MKGKKTGSAGRGPVRADASRTGQSRPKSGPSNSRDRKTGASKAPFAAQDRHRPESAIDAPSRPKKPLPPMRPAKASDTSKPAHSKPVASKPADAAPLVTTSVQTVTVTPDENGMRVDRFLEARFPGLSFSHMQRIVRKGELRVNSKRVETKDRLEAGQSVRIPPLNLEEQRPKERPTGKDEETRAFLKSITLYEDDDMMVIDKPIGLAVQGGSGMTRHVDGMLDALTDRHGQKPRLVHRLDRETSGCLVIAKNRFSASALAKSFRARDTRKIYWALVAGVPRVKQGRISTYLAKGEDDEGDAKMVVARHGAEGATHAVTYYAVVETAAQKVSWLSMKPVTGRTHQLRAHAAHMGHPMIGDPKYFDIENWELPGGIQKRLHLLARRIVIPHPRTHKPIDVTAPLPPHMRQSWNLLGFETAHYDPIEDSPDE